jgi:hypothetical protein
LILFGHYERIISGLAFSGFIKKLTD